MRDVRPSRAAASQHGALTDADLTDADLTAYLARIGYGGPTDPTAEVLGDLVAGHNRSIPFENLDPVFGVPVFDLSAAALADEMVRRRHPTSSPV